jgi:hypothetical protein
MSTFVFFLAIVIELTEGWFNYRARVILIELLPPGLIRASFGSDILNTGGSWILVSFELLTTVGSDGSRVHRNRLPGVFILSLFFMSFCTELLLNLVNQFQAQHRLKRLGLLPIVAYSASVNF